MTVPDGATQRYPLRFSGSAIITENLLLPTVPYVSNRRPMWIEADDATTRRVHVSSLLNMHEPVSLVTKRAITSFVRRCEQINPRSLIDADELRLAGPDAMTRYAAAPGYIAPPLHTLLAVRPCPPSPPTLADLPNKNTVPRRKLT